MKCWLCSNTDIRYFNSQWLTCNTVDCTTLWHGRRIGKGFSVLVEPSLRIQQHFLLVYYLKKPTHLCPFFSRKQHAKVPPQPARHFPTFFNIFPTFSDNFPTFPDNFPTFPIFSVVSENVVSVVCNQIHFWTQSVRIGESNFYGWNRISTFSRPCSTFFCNFHHTTYIYAVLEDKKPSQRNFYIFDGYTNP